MGGGRTGHSVGLHPLALRREGNLNEMTPTKRLHECGKAAWARPVQFCGWCLHVAVLQRARLRSCETCDTQRRVDQSPSRTRACQECWEVATQVERAAMATVHSRRSRDSSRSLVMTWVSRSSRACSRSCHARARSESRVRASKHEPPSGPALADHEDMSPQLRVAVARDAARTVVVGRACAGAERRLITAAATADPLALAL